MRRILLLLSAIALSHAAVTAETAPSYKTDPKYVAAMAEGKKLAAQQRIAFAIDSYKKANKISGGKDVDSIDQIFSLQIKAGEYKDAVKTTADMQALAADAKERSIAEGNRGYALYLQAGDKGKPELLQAANEAFKSAIADYPKNVTAHFYQGKALARLNEMDAAGEAFKACVSCLSPKDPAYVRAQHFAANPSLSLAKMAPAFVVTALDGKRFNLDEMGGKVVLIDFWATWCGPCKEELPHIKKIAQEFANEPLVIISVSWDSDDAKWKDFVAKNEMTWVQYRDADHSLSTVFGINAIPHYFTIDSDGVLTAEMLGEGSNVEGKLKKLIAKARAARESAAQASAGN